MSCKLAKTSAYEEVVCKGYAVTRGNFEDLMLAVAVECCPLCNVGVAGPIERSGMAFVADNELASFVSAGKTDDE